METLPIYRNAVDRGLDGVVACTTQISSIEESTLSYRGYAIQDLAENSSYEEVVWLLWHGRLPTPRELETFKSEHFAQSKLEGEHLQLLQDLARVFPKNGHPMD